MRRIFSLFMAMMVMICAFTASAHAEAQNDEISRSEFLKTELLGTWEDCLSVTEVAIMDDGKCFLIDPYGDAKEYRYLLTEDIAEEDVEYFKRGMDEYDYIVLKDGTKIDYIEFFERENSLKGPDIAIYDIDVSETKGNEYAVVMLGHYVESTNPDRLFDTNVVELLVLEYIDNKSGDNRYRRAHLERSVEDDNEAEIYSSSENDNTDETGYIGDWASYEYSDALRINEDGVYQYSAFGDLSSGSIGLYKVYDDMNDIPTEYSSQIRRSYSVRDVKWIVLLDVVGNVFEFGYYDMNADEIWMPDQFVRK